MFLGIAVLTIVFGFIPLAIFLLTRRDLSPETFFMFPYILLVGVGGFFELLLTYFLKVDATYLFSIYTLLELPSIYYFFYKALYPKLGKGFSVIFISLYVLIWIVDICKFSGIAVSQPFATVYIILSVILLSIMWFRKVFIEFKIPILWKSTMFYFVSAILLYYSGTFFLFLMAEVIIEAKDLFILDFWFINITLSLLLKTILTIAIWQGRMK